MKAETMLALKLQILHKNLYRREGGDVQISRKCRKSSQATTQRHENQDITNPKIEALEAGSATSNLDLSRERGRSSAFAVARRLRGMKGRGRRGGAENEQGCGARGEGRTGRAEARGEEWLRST